MSCLRLGALYFKENTRTQTLIYDVDVLPAIARSYLDKNMKRLGLKEKNVLFYVDSALTAAS